MSIIVNDFRWEPGKNDREYIQLLESSRDEWQKIANKAIMKLRTLSKVQVDKCRECIEKISKTQEPRVLSVADIMDEHIIPDVIWVERRYENDVCAGVWQIDHYEMIFDGVMNDLSEEIAEKPELYNTLWRCWTSRPSDKQRKAVKWE